MNASVKQSKSTSATQDAVAMLIADHKKVKALFEEFKQLTSQDGADHQKSALVALICQELTVHAQLEEEIFYPAVREPIDDEDLMDEAIVEHACAKELIAQLQDMNPEDDLYDAKVTVLGEQIQHHVKEEEGEMFSKVKKSEVDTAALGEQMAARKSELNSAYDSPSEDDDEQPAAVRKVASSKRSSTARPARQ